MNGETIEFASDGGTTPGYLARPEGGSGPGLVVIQEWWGLVGHVRDLVDRFAAAGFVALAPDLYHGERTKSPDEAGKLMMALDIDRAARDIRSAADHLLALDGVKGERVGVMGFCMGGQLALHAGQEHPDRFAAVVDFYGIHPSVPLAPERVKVPVLAHFGRRDHSVPPAVADELVRRLREGGADVEAYSYDADHAFFNDQRPEVHDAGASKLAWERTLDFLRRHLPG